jgi:chemotaxis protein histidine kinase CheA
MAGTPGNISYGIQTGTARGTEEAARLVNKYVKLVQEAKSVAAKSKHYSNFQANLNKIYNKEAKEFAELARQVAVTPPAPSPSPRRSPARTNSGRPPRPPRMTPSAAQMRNNIIRNLRVQLKQLTNTRNHWQRAVNSKQRAINAILSKHQQS